MTTRPRSKFPSPRERLTAHEAARSALRKDIAWAEYQRQLWRAWEGGLESECQIQAWQAEILRLEYELAALDADFYAREARLSRQKK